MKSFKIQLFIALFALSQLGIAQTPFFKASENQKFQIDQETKDAMREFASQQKELSVNKSYAVTIDGNIYDQQTIAFQIDGTKFSANLLKQNVRDGKYDFTWYGKTNENRGVFFKVKNGTVTSSFQLNGTNYILTPISKTSKTHILFDVSYPNTDKDCGNVADSTKKIITIFPPPPNPFPIDRDAGCTLRLLIAVTQAARSSVSAFIFDLRIDNFIETTNLAYILSEIDVTLELAVLIDTPYIETGNDITTDLNRFRNGTNGLGIAHTYREIYDTDVQMLITDTVDPIAAAIAFDVPQGIFQFNDDNAYTAFARNGFQRQIVLAHEIAHLQGVAHDFDNGFTPSPLYARGFVDGTANNSRRSIMATRNAVGCDFGDCREVLFSNPDVTGPNGTPFGNANRNAARRIRETSIFLRNYRTVPTNLFLQSETIENNFISNHLARNIIDTNNNNIFYENGSEGTIRAANEIVLRPGTYIQQGSDVRVYLDSDPCANLPFRAAEIIEESQEELKLEVTAYPNPTESLLNLDFNKEMGNYTVEIYDFNNTKVFSEKYNEVSKSTRLDLSNLRKGTYILRLIQGDQVITKQIIKQ